jgi:hypothetical protein
MVRARGVLLALLYKVALASAAAAQRKPVVAVKPAGYFRSDAESAQNVTQALANQFQTRGYRVIPLTRSQTTFASMRLSTDRHLSDRVALRLGDALKADLVVYPRVLGVGIPASDRSEEASRAQPSVILLLRVLNVHNGQAIFVRQISHRFDSGDTPEGGYRVTQSDATAATRELIQPYFQRVAGTRQEYRRPR